MIKRYKESSGFRHLFWLTIAYVLAHWFILVSTGRWWDDWVYADHNAEYVMEVFRQSSLPLAGIVNIIIWHIPYKVFVFGMFYAGGILLYKILNQIDFCMEEDAFWISALFLIIPVNDARIMYICFNYSLGLFCFLLSFYLVTKWIKQEGKSRIIIRILSLLILLPAFNAESVMLMVGLILLYLYYEELKIGWDWTNPVVNIKKIWFAVVHYMDYLLLPIANYSITKLLFPGYGVYGGHSYILWDTLADTIKNSPRYTWDTFKLIFDNWKQFLTDKPAQRLLCITILLCLAKLCYNKKKGRIENCEEYPQWKRVLFLLWGMFTFYLGAFPYIVKRESSLGVIYTDGRDALLLGIGTAIIIYNFVHLFIRKELSRTVLTLVIVSGIIYFNNVYLVWEKSHYQQMQIRDEMATNQEILNNNNFIVIYSDAVICSDFYQTNGNSWVATGEQTRHYMSGTAELPRLLELNENSWVLNAYMMKDFDYTDKTIDGVIYVNYSNNYSGKGRMTILKQKWNELFHKDKFEQWIRDIKDIKYFAITPEQSDTIIKAYQNGELTDTNLIHYIL